MKIKATNSLAQFGIKAYKYAVLDVDDKTGEMLVKAGFAEKLESKKAKAKKDK